MANGKVEQHIGHQQTVRGCAVDEACQPLAGALVRVIVQGRGGATPLAMGVAGADGLYSVDFAIPEHVAAARYGIFVEIGDAKGLIERSSIARVLAPTLARPDSRRPEPSLRTPGLSVTTHGGASRFAATGVPASAVVSARRVPATELGEKPTPTPLRPTNTPQPLGEKSIARAGTAEGHRDFSERIARLRESRERPAVSECRRTVPRAPDRIPQTVGMRTAAEFGALPIVARESVRWSSDSWPRPPRALASGALQLATDTASSVATVSSRGLSVSEAGRLGHQRRAGVKDLARDARPRVIWLRFV